jgi:hypothetical protein
MDDRVQQEAKVTELPRARLGGKTYFVDWRLGQLRNVDDPHDYIDFTVLA